MKKWKKYSFWILLVVNVSAGFFYTWGMLTTIVLIWLNYQFTSSMKKMMVLDSIFVVTAQVMGWISYASYAEELQRTNPTDVGAVIMGLINIVHLVASLFLILVMMTWSFYINGKKKQAGITGGILAAGVFCAGVFIYLLIGSFPYENSSTYVYKDAQCVCSDKYEGMVDFDTDSVVIHTHDGKKVALVTRMELGIYPDQIALGDDFFYVWGGDEDDKSGTIVKVDYNSRVIGRRDVGQTGLLTCQDGTIFLGNENEEEEPEIINGYYASRYIAESDFEDGEIKECKADGNGICRVGNEVLYEHEGYFSTNPVIPSYKESNYYKLEAGKELNKKEQTEWTKIVEKLLEEKDLRKMTCFVDEHQEGNVIYGVVNVRDSVLGFPEKKLKCALAYRILCKSKRIQILREMDGVFMILATEDCVVYQDGTGLWRESYSGKEKKKLIEISDTAYLDVQIDGEYLVIDEDEEVIVNWRKERAK